MAKKLQISTRFALAVLGLATAAQAQKPPRQPLLTLPDAVSIANGEQPAVGAYHLEAEAKEEAAIAAESLPDPRLTLGIQNYPIIRGESAFSPTEERMTMFTIGVMREQVRRSKREAQAARIRADALVSRRQASAEQRRIRREVMIGWIDAVEARAKQHLLERLIADLRTGREVAEAGIATGSTAPSQALEADADIALVQAQLVEARTGEAQARAELSRWLGAAASRPLPDKLPGIDAPAAVPADIMRLSTHPAVQVESARQEAAARQVEVARQDRKSDLSWSVMLGVRPEYGEVISGQVSIPLQINRGRLQDRRVAEAQARADAARLRVEDERRDLERQYRLALAAYEGAEAELARMEREAVPALEAAFEAAEARYSGGAGSLDRPFDIVRRYVETTVRTIEVRAKRDRAAAEIIYVLGEASQ